MTCGINFHTDKHLRDRSKYETVRCQNLSIETKKIISLTSRNQSLRKSAKYNRPCLKTYTILQFSTGGILDLPLTRAAQTLNLTLSYRKCPGQQKYCTV